MFFLLPRYLEEGRRRQQQEEDMELLKDFRKPRDSLLCVAAEFFSCCHPRIRELRKSLADPTLRPPELLDTKAHIVRPLSLVPSQTT